MHWIEELALNYIDSEAPNRFFYWAGVSAIAAVVKKNVWLDRHMYKMYPNCYVFLLASSGMKKGVPISIARKLIEGVNNTRVVSGRNSIQQVLADFAKPYLIADGQTLKHAHGILVASELDALFTDDPKTFTMLTDLHDASYHEGVWQYSLKSGTSKLYEPCVSFFAASNEEHFHAAIPPGQITGGFIARTYVVYENRPGKLNSLTEKPNEIRPLSDYLDYLKEISQAKGEMQWSDNAKKAYDAWYYPYAGGITEDKTGTKRRAGDQILRLAMIISLAESTKLTLEAHHIQEAILQWSICADNVNRLVAGRSSSSNDVNPIAMILKELLDAKGHTRTRKWFLKQCWNNGITGQIFDIAMMSFLESRAVITSGAGDALTYTLESSVVAEYIKNEKELKEIYDIPRV